MEQLTLEFEPGLPQGHDRKMFEACMDALLGPPCQCNRFAPNQLPGNPWHGKRLYLDKGKVS